MEIEEVRRHENGQHMDGPKVNKLYLYGYKTKADFNVAALARDVPPIILAKGPKAFVMSADRRRQSDGWKTMISTEEQIPEQLVKEFEDAVL